MISTPKPRLSLFKLYESPESGESLLLLLLPFFFREAGIGFLNSSNFTSISSNRNFNNLKVKGRRKTTMKIVNTVYSI